MMISGHLRVQNGIWQMIISYKDASGNRKTISRSTHLPQRGNKKRAEEMLLELRIQLSQEIAVQTPNSGTLFHMYLEHWLELALPGLSPSTQVSYSRIIRRNVIPYFKENPIEMYRLKAMHISAYYQFLLQNGLSPNSVKRVHANIHKALKQAVIDGIIPLNPAEGLSISNPNHYTADYLSQKECQILLSTIKNTPLEIPITLAIMLGLRRSELLGLQWESVDFETHTIHICCAMHRIKGEIIERQTLKRKSSYRTLPITDELEKLLLPHHKAVGYVCIDENGKPYTPDRLYCQFQKALSQAGLRHIRLHDLRHTCAALLLQGRMPIAEVSNFLGHSSIAITMDLYGHLEFSSKEACSSLLTEKILR